MGVLSDFIIADRNEAAAINQAEGAHFEKWKCLESRGIDPVKLGTLWAILSGSEFDPGFMGGSLLDQGSDHGPWVILVPSNLVAALAALENDRIQSVAYPWAQTEEFQLFGWSEDAVFECFEKLVGFARQAQSDGRDLLLWMSL